MVEGGRVVSAPNASIMKVVARNAGSMVTLRATRTGDLPPLSAPKIVEGPDYSIDPMLGDLLKDPRARAIIVKYLPTLGADDQLGLAPQIRLRAMQPYAPEMNDAVVAKIDAALRPQLTGNPLRLPMGVCDPQIRIYDDVAWLALPSCVRKMTTGCLRQRSSAACKGNALVQSDNPSGSGG